MVVKASAREGRHPARLPGTCRRQRRRRGTPRRAARLHGTRSRAPYRRPRTPRRGRRRRAQPRRRSVADHRKNESLPVFGHDATRPTRPSPPNTIAPRVSANGAAVDGVHSRGCSALIGEGGPRTATSEQPPATVTEHRRTIGMRRKDSSKRLVMGPPWRATPCGQGEPSFTLARLRRRRTPRREHIEGQAALSAPAPPERRASGAPALLPRHNSYTR
jgi:hypothetical protein